MITKKSDEEMLELTPCKLKWFRFYWAEGYRQAEAELLPEIERLEAEELMHYSADDMWEAHILMSMSKLDFIKWLKQYKRQQ